MKTLKKILQVLLLLGSILVGIKIYLDKTKESNVKPIAKKIDLSTPKHDIYSKEKDKWQRTVIISEKEQKAKRADFNERQLKLLAVLNKEKDVEMKLISKMFPEYSERTLRRDFNLLEEMGLVTRSGTTKATVYHYHYQSK
ncbi:MAG: DeoR family transcriptional regulator [bacterium]